MQTIQLLVKDDYMQNVLDMLGSVKDIMIEKIEIQKDINLELDPYFYERREELHKIHDNIQSGSIKMYDEDEWKKQMQKLDKELDVFYAN